MKWLQDGQAAPSTARSARNFSWRLVRRRWWETSVSLYPLYRTLTDTTGPKKLFCQNFSIKIWLHSYIAANQKKISWTLPLSLLIPPPPQNMFMIWYFFFPKYKLCLKGINLTKIFSVLGKLAQNFWKTQVCIMQLYEQHFYLMILQALTLVTKCFWMFEWLEKCDKCDKTGYWKPSSD